MNNSQISVMMPVYNSESYVSLAIKSILNQTYKNFEFLIIDDGSIDKTEEIVNSFKDSRINYKKKSHEGVSKSLNYGLMKASNDIIAIMDSDDISHINRLEKQLECFKKSGCRIISSWYCVFYKNKMSYIVKTPELDKEIRRKLLLHSVICHASSMYDRRLITAYGGYNDKYDIAVEYDLWIRLMDKVSFYNIPEVLHFYRTRKESLTNKNFEKTLSNTYKVQSSFQKNDFVDNNILKNKNEEILIRGWREFFYGDKRKARKIWITLKMKLFINPKIIIAILICFLPQRWFLYFKKIRIKFRVQYFLKYFTKDNIFLRKYLNEFENLI